LVMASARISRAESSLKFNMGGEVAGPRNPVNRPGRLSRIAYSENCAHAARLRASADLRKSLAEMQRDSPDQDDRFSG
jgi:hypothetical protein